MIIDKNLAIQTALRGDWAEAIKVNEELLRLHPSDIETLNRLAFAYNIIGKVQEAKETYEKVLTIDGCNPIALKNLGKLKCGTMYTNDSGFHITTNTFLEEIGKTKIVALLNVAPPKLLKTLQTGQLVHLNLKRMKIFVLDEHEQYIGMLPDNLAKRLTEFMKEGNTYETFVKSVEGTIVNIFIKETHRVEKLHNIPSFAASGKK